MAGFVLALVMTMGVEVFSAVVHPVPPGVDLRELEACRAHVARYPAWVLAVVVVAWGATTMLASWLATRLGTRRLPVHGYVITAVLLALVVFNMSMLPYPWWFWVGNLATFPLAGHFGARAARG
jgi:Mn2+/Fe2+ NRAMP family transporter